MGRDGAMAGRRAARRCVTVVIPYVLVLVFVNHLRLVVITHEQQDEGIAQETFNLAVRDNGKLATPSKPITNETRPLIPVSQVGISSYNTTKTPKSRDGKGQRPAEDCSRLKPAYGTETQTFQPFHDQGHVFSAHHDTRDNTIKASDVFVYFMVPSSNGNIFRVTEFPSQRPVTRRFDAFFYLRLNERLSKQS